MKQSRAFILAAFASSIAVACSGPPPLTSKLVTHGSGGAGGAGTSMPTATEPTTTEPTSGGACGPIGDRYRPSSLQALKEALHGTWNLCSELGLFRRPQDALRIGADDRYVFLTRQGDALVPQTGLENQGHLEYLDTSSANGPGSIQVNFVGDLDITIISHPVFSDVPRIVVINNNGVDEYRYSRLDSIVPNQGQTVGADGPSPAAIKQPTGEVACGPTGAPLAPPSSGALTSALHGTWVLCSPLGLFRKPQAGVYIGPDNRWTLLERRDGKLVPLDGLDNKGAVEVLDYQVNFTSDLGFTIIAGLPVLSDMPRLLTINNNGVDQYVYSFVP